MKTEKTILTAVAVIISTISVAQIRLSGSTTIKVVSGTTLNISGDFTTNNATLNNQGVVLLKGSLENNTSGLFDSLSTGAFTFAGSSQQEITGNADAGFYGNSD